MTPPANHCPEEGELERFLNQLPTEGSIEEHVNNCSRCQQRLQDITAVISPDWQRLLPLDPGFQLKADDTALLVDRVSGKEITAPSLKSINRFQIESELGRGGMGIVYLATDPDLGRRVAIKLLARQAKADNYWLERFQREARLAGSLNHPNVLTIHEIGEADGTPYIATEFVRGVTLRQRLETFELTEEEILHYAVQLVGGLAAAHGAGIVHRDLKPDNVMIRDDGLLKILDFGLARMSVDVQRSDDSISIEGAVVGTVSYMSPEQARGLELTVSSDVFSLGTLLYQMLTGERPFEGETPSDVMAAILTRAPRTFDSCSSDVSPRLMQLVMRCLNKEPKSRPTSADVLTELQESSTLVKLKAVASSSKGSSTAAQTEAGFNAGEIRYARSEDVNIAWQAIGDGPIDIVFVMGWVSHLEWFWKDPSFAAFLRRLASFSRVILFDKRGTGLSDKVPVDGLPTLEMRMDDVRAVMEAAGSKRAVLLGVSEGGPLCTLFAATYPEKTIAMAMMGSYSRRLWAEDYPWGPTEEQREQFLEDIARNWGGPLGIEDRAPSKADDPAFRKWWASYLRMGASPGAAVALTRMNAQIDVRPILPSIQVPTLVIHRSGDRCLRVEEGRHMADLIPGAKFVELPGDDHLPFVGDSKAVLDQIEEFLSGMRATSATDQVLATVLCVMTEADLGSKLEQLHESIRGNAELFRGQNIVITNRRMLLTFDGPARAVRAASSFVGLANGMGIDVRCGADTGMCEIGDTVLLGPAAKRAIEIADVASMNEVLVSNTVLNLTSGAGLTLIEAMKADDVRAYSIHRLVD
ncbi:MAG: alpha/beta fold hydrolase [Planctomycetaceae bacterium]